MSETLAMFGLPGGWEWIIILLVALLVFGRRLPDVARSIGRSIVEFKRGLHDIKDDIERDDESKSSDQRRLERKSGSDDSPQSTSDDTAEHHHAGRSQ